ncbi:MAG: hypothetical protein AAB470_00395 [Patescibacteria group bacterium]
MNYEISLWIAVITVVLVLVLVIQIVYQFLVQSKHQMRTAELIRRIDTILEESGCDHADNLLTECIHIIDHYKINLVELDFRRMITIGELRHATLASMERYYKRMSSLHEKTCAEYKELMDITPEKRSLDQRSRYAQLREIVTNFGGELNNLHAKINASRVQLG